MVFVSYQPSSVRGWTSAFLLAVHRLCGIFEGRLSHFLPRWLRTGWKSAISQGKIPWNTAPWLGIEPGPWGKTDSELSHWAIMTRVTGRTDSELSHWAIITRVTGKTDSEWSHWAIMTQPTGRTDSELSHWAIMADFRWSCYPSWLVLINIF